MPGRKCPLCGAELPEAGLDGLCPRCVVRQVVVKRAKGLKAADRRNFVSELQTWIDLPDHANLVPCRFFRTLGDEVLIFAEYVEGGSLKEWIDTKKLYEGGSREALERILTAGTM